MQYKSDQLTTHVAQQPLTLCMWSTSWRRDLDRRMATVEVLNPPPMYRIRPYFTIKKVKLPDCMYLLKPVHQLPNLTPSQEVL